jgi:predicted CXXCH cytochrome family protein
VALERIKSNLQLASKNLLLEILVPLAIVVFVARPPLSYAGTHPVPLEKNADTAKCLECHEDKTKGKAVHSAIAMGCTTCHEIRVNRDITRVKLTTTTVSGLCFTCHADKNPEDLKGTIHPPAVRDCAKCHDPHATENKYQLLKPASGGPNENLCLTCHDMGVHVPEKGSRHAALDMGCDTCHVTHKTGPAGKEEFDFHLAKASPALCLDCHEAKDANLQKAHQDQPFGSANCVQCHDPHQSDKPKLLQKYAHPPFADKTCEICHAPAKDGKVVLTQADAKALCVTCHDEQAKKIESAKVPHPGAQGDCTSCHNPHAGKTPGFLQPDPVTPCLTCHSDQADQMKKAHLHQPAFRQGCATCHEPHGGENQHLLRAKNTNSLCLECHGPDSHPQKLESEHVVKLFSGTVQVPEDYFAKNKVVVLPLKYGRGHPVAGHPISDVTDPSDVTKLRAKIDCLTCHQPHASAQPDLLAKDQANNMAFCATCHTDLTKR